MFTGLPDFGRPEHFGMAEGYIAYEQPGVLSVVPGSLRAEPLQVDQYLQERDGRVARFAVVTAGFTLDTAMDTTTGDAERPPLLARPAPLGEGLVRLTAPTGLGVPDAALAPQPCDAATGMMLPTFVRLDGVAGDLLIGALRSGLLTLGAVVLVTVRGLATRCPGTLKVDLDALLRGIGSSPVRPQELEERIRTGLPGITVTRGPDDAHLVSVAVIDRIVTRLAEPAFLDESDGGWRFPAAGVEPTTLTWDLTEPVVGVRLVRRGCDPVLGEGGDAAVRQHTAPPLTDGRERLVVHSTLPALPAGVVTALVKLTAPPAPPDRPFKAEATAHLVPPQPVSATLHLAPGEALVYDIKGSAVMESDRGPRTLTGADRRVTGDSTPVVTPADLGLRVIAAHASDDLLDLADVTVTTRATRLTQDSSVFISRAPLPADTGRAWVAVPRDASEVTVAAEATTRGPAPRTVRQSLPDAAIWLDPFSFTDPPWGDGGPDEERLLVVEAAGLRVVGPKGGADWRFLPLTAGLVRDVTGSPQLSLLEPAGMAMLMVTTALQVSDAAQEAARKACVAAGAAGDVRLSPALFEVEGSAQLLLRQDRAVASTVPSGTVTQDAAFSATLTEADLAVVHRSLAGEAGLLTVRYLLKVTATGPQALALAGGPDPVLVVTDASTWRT